MESEEFHDMSSLDTEDCSKITTIKIELEKVLDSSPTAGGERNLNQEYGVVMCNVNTDSMDTTSELVHNKTLESNTVVEVPITGVRYFKSIGKSNTLDISDGISGPSADISTTVPANVEVARPVLPYSVSIVHTDSTGNLHESQCPASKPPTYNNIKSGKVELYAPDTGPKIYNVKGNIVTRPLITKNIPEAFSAQPVHGKAESNVGLKDFFERKIRDYIGYDISDNEFGKLHEFMNGDYLRTGLELTTSFSFPSQGPFTADLKSPPLDNGPGQNLCIVKKLELRVKKDAQNHYPRKLKYRGLRMLPLSLGNEGHKMSESTGSGVDGGDDELLEPGTDLIFRARIYRPYSYGSKDERDKKSTRHSVFKNDMVMVGRQRLTTFRDRIACANDIGMRVDVSDNPDLYTSESAKKVFPSGFLFINNVFYVDRRVGCADHSAVIREWARRRGLGDFPVRDMGAVRLDEVVLRLGHPEVYMHQGKCEHLFTFSEVRLLGPTDPLRLSHYPCFTQISLNQSVYCTTCAEFGAKWVVVGCTRVPFDPAFFCETCFRFYLYDRDGNKIGDFKAYSYKGNTVNFTKPITGAFTRDAGSDDNQDSESESP